MKVFPFFLSTIEFASIESALPECRESSKFVAAPLGSWNFTKKTEAELAESSARLCL